MAGRWTVGWVAGRVAEGCMMVVRVLGWQLEVVVGLPWLGLEC